MELVDIELTVVVRWRQSRGQNVWAFTSRGLVPPVLHVCRDSEKSGFRSGDRYLISLDQSVDSALAERFWTLTWREECGFGPPRQYNGP